MNLLKDLEHIYNMNEESAGIVGEKNVVLFPLYHAAQNTQITVTINMAGEFLKAVVNPPEEEFTVIPTTLDSSCRCSNNAPHGCGDRVDYLSGNMKDFFEEIAADAKKQERNEKRYEVYMKQLCDWAESPYATPKVQAIYEYEAKNELLSDLLRSQVFPNHQGESLTSKMKINKISIDTCAVRFRVEYENAEPDYIPETWLDKEMFRSWSEYYSDVVSKTFQKDYCYVTGEYIPITTKHSNGIRANSDFAKLISSNENGMIVYTGDKFKDATDAVVIGYETSLKAHNALRWLISLQGRRSGENILVAWDDNGNPVLVPYEVDTPTAFGYSDNPEEEKLFDTKEQYFEFLERHYDSLNEKIDFGNGNGKIHFLELDSSFKGDLKGRISVLDYQVYSIKEYYENVFSWHKKYFWNIFKGKENKFTGSPSIYDFIMAAYGTESKMGLSVSSKSLFTRHYNRIVKCIVFGYPLPDDIVMQLVYHASSPMKYPLSKSKIGTIACAAINGKENMDIMLNKSCVDRDYLFGRLLAVANYAERLTFTETDKGRETNAIRFMSDFVNAPATTWGLIFQKLQPYLKKLNRNNAFVGEIYRREIDEIASMIAEEDFTDNRLGNKYLLGFSAQSTALRTRRVKKEEAKDNGGNEE